MLRINQLKLPAGHTQEQLRARLLHVLHIREKDLKGYTVRKRSLDARRKPELYYVYSVDFETVNEGRLLKQLKGKVQMVEERTYSVPAHGTEPLRSRPVVIGSGPAGLFCAYLLSLKATARLSSNAAPRSESALKMCAVSGKQAC